MGLFGFGNKEKYEEVTFFIDDSYIAIYHNNTKAIENIRELEPKELDKEIEKLLKKIKDNKKTYLISIVTNSNHIFIRNIKDKKEKLEDKLFITDYFSKNIKKNSVMIVDRETLIKSLFVLFKNLEGFKLNAIYDFSIFNSLLLEKQKNINSLYINISTKYTTIAYSNTRVQRRVINIGVSNFNRKIIKNKRVREFFKYLDKNNLSSEIEKLESEYGYKKELYDITINFIQKLKYNIEVTIKLFKDLEKDLNIKNIKLSGEIEKSYSFLIEFLKKKLNINIETLKSDKDTNSIYTTLNSMQNNRDILKKIEIKEKDLNSKDGLIGKDDNGYFFLVRGELKIKKDLTTTQKKKYDYRLGASSRYKEIDVNNNQEEGIEGMGSKKDGKLKMVHYLFATLVILLVVNFYLNGKNNNFKSNDCFWSFASPIYLGCKKDSVIKKFEDEVRGLNIIQQNILSTQNSSTNKNLLSSDFIKIDEAKPNNIWITSIDIDKERKISLEGKALDINKKAQINISIFENKLNTKLINYKATVNKRDSNKNDKYIDFEITLEKAN